MQKWQQHGEKKRKKKVCLHSELAFASSTYTPWAATQISQRLPSRQASPWQVHATVSSSTALGFSFETADHRLPFWGHELLDSHTSLAPYRNAKATNRISFSELFAAAEVVAP